MVQASTRRQGVRQLSRHAPVAAVGAALMAFYWISAATNVGGGNWGEFQTFGYQGGIPHSPGYPLLTGSIYAATRVLRFVEPAHAANLVNATFAALAGLLLFVVARKLTRSWPAALLTTVVFTTGFSTWEHAVQAEMMSLQTLLVFGMVAAMLWFDERPDDPRLGIVAFATGLSLTNHGIGLFMLPATGAFVSVGRFRRLLRPRPLLLAGAGLVVGLLPWLYVARGLFTKVPVNRPEDLQRLSLDELLYLTVQKPLNWVSSTDALTSPLGDGGPSFITTWPRFAHDLLREFGWAWLVAGLIGWAWLARTRLRLAAWIAWTALTTLWFALSTPPLLDVDRYFVVVYALLAICLAVAIGQALRRVAALSHRVTGADAARTAALVAVAVVLALAGLRVVKQFSGPARVNVMRQRENADEQALIGEGVVRHMAPDSVYMTNWTSSWYSRYAVYVKGLSKGVEIRTTDYGRMGIEQAEQILRRGRNLYLQRSTPEYERQFKVIQRAGVFYQVELNVEDARIPSGDGEPTKQ